MLLVRFLQMFARIEAPTQPAKLRFLLHTEAGEPDRLAHVKACEFDVADATWTVALAPGMKVAATPPEKGTDEDGKAKPDTGHAAKH